MTTKIWDYFACEEQAVRQLSWQSNLLTFRQSKKYSIGSNGNRNSLCGHLTSECQATHTWLKQKLETKAQAQRLLFSLGFVRRCIRTEEEKTQSRQPWARGDLSVWEGRPGPQGGHKYRWVQEISGGKQGADSETPATIGACARLGAGDMSDTCIRNHPAGTLGFPVAPSVPGVTSPIHEVFPGLPEKPWGTERWPNFMLKKYFAFN